MYTTTLALALAPFILLVRADVSLDRDDVPSACSTICNPIVELSRACDVNLRSDNDRDEDLLEVQCVCTNDSFDVGSIAALCADCIRQNPKTSDNDDDDDDRNEDLQNINDILYTCGFTSASYVASASRAAQSVTVAATAPTDISQLSTTIVPGRTGTGTETGTIARPTATAATTSGSGSGADDNDDDDDSNSNASSSTSTDNAAPAVTPFGVAGAFVAGAMIFLA
ncbi:hypothetical protein G7046_g1188 [Stylonectria norvegica]|nr:hypothetical protein G7046_g1188 [Stylonectria norvegica]